MIVLQVIVAIFLILVVLLQPGNRGGMSAALGGAGGETVFGARGANTFLSKLTFGAAAVFMVTSVTLSFMSLPPKSVVDQALQQKAPATAPATPAPAAPTTTSAPAPAAPAATTAPAPSTPSKK
jgi:preprotein translocase subunit SecG